MQTAVRHQPGRQLQCRQQLDNWWTAIKYETGRQRSNGQRAGRLPLRRTVLI